MMGIEVQAPERVNLAIVPDRLLNNDNVIELARALHSLYRAPIDRLSLSKTHVMLQPAPVLSWETWCSSKSIQYILGGPLESEKFFRNKVSACWPRATVQTVTTRPIMEPAITVALTLHMREHYFLSLLTDRRTLAPVPALLEATNLLEANDLALVQVLLIPASSDWYQGAENAYQQYRQGLLPQRLGLDLPTLGIHAARFLAGVGLEMAAVVSEFITEQQVNSEPVGDNDRNRLMRHGGLSHATLQKGREEAFDLCIRVAVQSESIRRRETALRALSTAFRSLDQDNGLQSKRTQVNRTICRAIREQTPPAWKLNADYVTPPEVAHLLYLPTAPLQVDYPRVNSIALREQMLPDRVTSGRRVLIGSMVHKGEVTSVGWPVNDRDELCLPRVNVGGMGSGKTTAVGNFALGAMVEAGASCFVHDVADGKLCDEVRDALPADFPADHIIDLDFGNPDWPIPLDWADIAERATGPAANRLSSELAGFLERFSDTDAGARTRRWLKKAAQAVYTRPDATLLDNLLMLTSVVFRKEVLASVADPLVLEAWHEYEKMSPAMQNQLAQPVLNRLDYLLDDEILKNLLCQPPLRTAGGRPAIDFRRWADGDERGPYCVLLRVPKGTLDAAATDAIMTWLNCKEWLAILTRQDQPIDQRRPCFAIYDEPHQFPSIAARAKEQVVEARKWRFGLVWSFHSWAQIDAELAAILRAGGPHYMLFQTAKEAWQRLTEEIAPFTVEEAINLPRYHAIVRMQAGGSPVPPFIAQAAPPAPRVEDRSRLKAECSMRYGRPAEQVRAEMLRRERHLWQVMTEPGGKKQ